MHGWTGPIRSARHRQLGGTHRTSDEPGHIPQILFLIPRAASLAQHARAQKFNGASRPHLARSGLLQRVAASRSGGLHPPQLAPLVASLCCCPVHLLSVGYCRQSDMLEFPRSSISVVPCFPQVSSWHLKCLTFGLVLKVSSVHLTCSTTGTTFIALTCYICAS